MPIGARAPNSRQGDGRHSWMAQEAATPTVPTSAAQRAVVGAVWVALVAPQAPAGKTGRPPFPVEAPHDEPLFPEFAGLGWDGRLPDQSAILRLRHLLERHQLAERILTTINALLLDKGLMFEAGTVVDAILIAAPSSTKHEKGERGPEMHQTKKGKQWRVGMKAHGRTRRSW